MKMTNDLHMTTMTTLTTILDLYYDDDEMTKIKRTFVN